METIKIPFSGINRSIDEGISSDGQCMELINARIKNGGVEPIGNPVLISELPVNAEKLYYHSLAKRYICITNTGELLSLNEDFTISEHLTPELTGIVTCIEFVGKIACLFTERGLKYCIFKEDSYSYVGNLGELPDLNVSFEKTFKTTISENKFSKHEDFLKTESSFVDKVVSSLNKDGYFFGGGGFLIRYALRTINGEYILHSPVVFSECSDIYKQQVNLQAPGSVVNATITMTDLHSINSVCTIVPEPSHGFYIVYGLKPVLSFDDMNLSGWEDLAISVDVFISPISWYKKEGYKKDSSSAENLEYQMYSLKTPLEINESVVKEHTFFKYAEFDLHGNQLNIIDNVSTDNISIQERLTDDPNSHNFITGESTYVYNSRLHIANIKEALYDGYKSGYKLHSEESPMQEADIYTHIDTEQGKRIVKNTVRIPCTISPLITYPNSNAYKIVVVCSGKKKEYILSKHQYLNIAYYLEPVTYVDTGIVSFGKTVKKMVSGIDTTKYSQGSISVGVMDGVVNRPNVLKVSSLNNPLSFPPAQTYQPSSEEIIGMCANTNALSQGQFGQHPLYVFAKDGIYAMSVGSGNVVYSAQVPVSRDTCVNKNSIKGIDQAVVFASKRGLMMIGGNSAKLISADLDGYLSSCISSSPIISKIANIASMANALSSVTFNEYIEGAEIGYNYQENELYLSNKNFQYGYVFNITSASWSKIHPNPSSFVNKYPECLAIIDNRVYDMQNNHRSVSKMLLLSKPIKMGSSSHKRILQTALRGIVKRAMSDLYLRGKPVIFRGEELNIFTDVGLYILGSNDAEHFTLISGKESIVDVRDLVTKMNKSKPYKYFMMALVGGVRTDVSLNYMEFVASEAFANRLR